MGARKSLPHPIHMLLTKSGGNSVCWAVFARLVLADLGCDFKKTSSVFRSGWGSEDSEQGAHFDKRLCRNLVIWRDSFSLRSAVIRLRREGFRWSANSLFCSASRQIRSANERTSPPIHRASFARSVGTPSRVMMRAKLKQLASNDDDHPIDRPSIPSLT